MTPLERSYRRLLRLYPRRYRVGREEEMLGVLLDAAALGQRQPTAADVADLTVGASRARAADASAWARRRPGAAAGWLALTVGLLVPLLPPTAPGAGLPDALPSRFAGYSYLTGSAADSPPGPAVALYGQGVGAEFMDFPQTIVAGASGAHRRLEEGGLLSPDGTRVASGEGYGEGSDHPEVAVRDLTTGAVVHHVVDGGRFAGPAAWSPDGHHLAVITTGVPLNGYFVTLDAPEVRQAGQVVLLDLATGAVRPVPGGQVPAQPSVAAFSPDGGRLAVQDVSGELVLVDLADGATRSLGHPGHLISGDTAWSPDGALLATVQPLPFRANSRQCDHFIAVVGGDVPGCVATGPEGHHSFVGWTGARSVAVLVTVTEDGREADPATLVEVDLATGGRTTLSSIPTAGANYQVHGLQVAQSALASGQLREPGRTDRGRWTAVPRVLAAVGVAGAMGLVVRLVARCARRRPAGGETALSR